MKEYTDQKFFYKAVPVDYDGVARLKRIKGNTLAFNQLVNNGNFADTSAWGKYLATLTVSGNVGTVTATGRNGSASQNITVPVGHKLLFIVTAQSYTDSNTTCRIRDVVAGSTVNTQQVTLSTALKTYALEHTVSANTSYIQIVVGQDENESNWSGIKISNAMLIDLTLLNSPYITGYDSFKSYFPLSYYSYNLGTLLPFKGTSIKTVGKNQFDSSKVTTGVSTLVLTKTNGTVRAVYSGGQRYVGFNFYGSPLFTDTFIKGRYRLSFDVSGLDTQWSVGLRKDASFVGSQTIAPTIDYHYSFTIDTEANPNCYLSFSRTGNLTGAFDVTFSNIQLEYGTTETEYTPYVESTTNLPTLTYFPNGMNRVGNVYDELTENVAIKRLHTIIFDGTETFTTGGEGGRNFVYMISNQADFGKFNVYGLYSKGQWGDYIFSAPESAIGTVSFGVGVADRICFLAVGLRMTVDQFKQELATAYANGTPYAVCYELATPTETDINTEVFYPVYQYGTEQILPVNGTTPTTAPIWCDIEYYNQIESEIPYRKFWLVNGNGEKWNLTEKEIKSFLNNPSGLGFRKSIEITRYGERANKINEVYDFPQPQGELLFYDSVNSSRYDKYYEFTRFVMKQPITLYYQIPVSYNSMIADTYKLDCEVTELQKTESKPDRIMTTQIVFSGLGFYEGEEIEINGTGTTYTIENKGDFPVGFEITLEGSLMNPYITLSQDGEVYGEAKFDDTTAFSSVYVDSKDGEQNVILKQSGSILPNPLSYQDLSISNGSIYVTFVKLLRGVTELTIGRRSGSLTNVKIKYSPKYRSV